jgi:hypothetical protein
MPPAKKPNINSDAPFGWFLAGTHPQEYTATLDTKIRHSGSRSCCVSCKVKKASGWTTLMQNMGTAPYLGKRLRMSYWVRAEDVGYVSGWMRVDGASKGDMVSFDNMCNRKLEGTHEWTKQEIVLDVAEETRNIGFGVIFSGEGKMWADDFSFEVVDRSVPTTDCPCSPQNRNHSPKNLDFESDKPDKA